MSFKAGLILDGATHDGKIYTFEGTSELVSIRNGILVDKNKGRTVQTGRVESTKVYEKSFYGVYKVIDVYNGVNSRFSLILEHIVDIPIRFNKKDDRHIDIMNTLDDLRKNPDIRDKV